MANLFTRCFAWIAALVLAAVMVSIFTTAASMIGMWNTVIAFATIIVAYGGMILLVKRLFDLVGRG